MITTTSTAVVLLCLMVLSPSRNHQVSAVHVFQDLIPESIPVCFLPDMTLRDTYFCVRENASPQCFNDDSFSDILNCTATELPDFNWTLAGDGFYAESFFNSTRTCLDPYIDCVNDTLYERVQNMPPCVYFSLRNLTKCAIDNHEACLNNCSQSLELMDGIDFVEEEDLEDPFGAIDFMGLFTCSGIQNIVVEPVCEVIDCCEPCVEPYVALMECIVNDVLHHTLLPCDFDCPSSSGDVRRERQLLIENANDRNEEDQEIAAKNKKDSSSTTAPRRHMAAGDSSESQGITDLDSDSIDVISRVCLPYAPGLTERDGATELGAATPFFLPCIQREFLTVMENQSKQSSNSDATSNGASGGGDENGGNVSSGGSGSGGASDNAQSITDGMTSGGASFMGSSGSLALILVAFWLKQMVGFGF